MIKLYSWVLLPLFLLLLGCKEVSRQQPPNIVFILTDDQGYGDLGIYGATDIATPHLDQLAKDGARFTSYYATQPVCSASRASILTGCYSNRISIHNAFMPNAQKGINPEETTLAEMLKAKGYKTGIFGKWHLGDAPKFLPTRHGFDEFFGILYSNDMWPNHPQQGPVFNFSDLYLYENERPLMRIEDQSFLTEALTDKAVDFIENNTTQPFFLYLPHPQPHVPLFAGKTFLGRSERGLYGDVITEIDHSVGRIVKTLKENKLLENTMLVFTSDNGPWLSYGGHSGSSGIFREGKGTNWEGGHRVPGIVHYPDLVAPNTIIDAPAMGMDWLPTIAAITNSPLPKLKIDGKSLVPLLEGSTSVSPHDNLFFYYRTNELHAVRHKDWKMYFPHSYRSLNGRIGTNDGNPISYDQNKLLEPELYALNSDPEEQFNVAKQHPEMLLKITKIADSVRTVLGDQLKGIQGSEVRPAGQVEDR